MNIQVHVSDEKLSYTWLQIMKSCDAAQPDLIIQL